MTSRSARGDTIIINYALVTLCENSSLPRTVFCITHIYPPPHRAGVVVSGGGSVVARDLRGLLKDGSGWVGGWDPRLGVGGGGVRQTQLTDVTGNLSISVTSPSLALPLPLSPLPPSPLPHPTQRLFLSCHECISLHHILPYISLCQD
jgi:hypothetical protein